MYNYYYLRFYVKTKLQIPKYYYVNKLSTSLNFNPLELRTSLLELLLYLYYTSFTIL